MVKELKVGREFELQREVVPEITADRFGNPGAHVFATPMLVALLEEAAIGCVEPLLDPDEGTVGTLVNVQHLAATPLGMTITVRARLAEVDRRRLVFEVEASDGVDTIARGTHERFLVKSMPDFLAAAAAKGSS